MNIPDKLEAPSSYNTWFSVLSETSHKELWGKRKVISVTFMTNVRRVNKLNGLSMRAFFSPQIKNPTHERSEPIKNFK